MLTRLRIRNFKRFQDVEIELGPMVVFIGPNNSGKTTALQALALWQLGRDRYLDRRRRPDSATVPDKRPGVTINRRDLLALPIPDTSHLWRDLHLRDSTQTSDGKKRTQNVRIDVLVEGLDDADQPWRCGFEFDYSNEETFVCRPLREEGYEYHAIKDTKFTGIPKAAETVQIAFLPPMSGIASEEPKLEPGRIQVLLGEGQTAQVLRNLCHQIYERSRSGPSSLPSPESSWGQLCQQIQQLFGVALEPPEFVRVRGEIRMSYREQGSAKPLDLSCAGRGLQQTMLLLAHIYANPTTILLLDEPDAHLEILRQREIYNVISTTAGRQRSQVLAASHSEVILNEAGDRDVVVSFVGKPHRIDDRSGKSQVAKALREIGFDHYYQAETTGWILFLEGSTDLEILRAFAATLGHSEAQRALARPYFKPVGTNKPNQARDHFHALLDGKPDLVGIAIFDRLDAIKLSEGRDEPLVVRAWKRREIENYLCHREVLLAHARGELPDDLFGRNEAERRECIMNEEIASLEVALEKLGRPSPWSPDIKATDDFLDPLFANFQKRLGLPPGEMRKKDYHKLARLVPADRIDPEIREALDLIASVAARACPTRG